jgi:lysyl-tRNA synthetase class 2
VLSDKIKRLHDRAYMLGCARHFFDVRKILEVDCPSLSTRASIDAHIDLIPALYHHQEACYLHSSPEYGMKRLLSEGIGNCYQLSHVFRDGELSSKHNPEFMMAEWYRLGFNLEQMIEETIEFIRLFLGNLPYQIISYRELFINHTGIDYVTATNEDLFAYIQKHHIPFYTSILNEGKDALLNLILGSQIEPLLGQTELAVLAYYPSTQAALACKRWHGTEQVAERFEVYYRGIELANGYHELTDPFEQEQRFLAGNQQRIELGKTPLPLDYLFLEALKKGLPDCCGVAVGFDRLMMLRHVTNFISDVIAWGWLEA